MKFIDWFAGIGGFRRGMELAGHECVGFCYKSPEELHLKPTKSLITRLMNCWKYLRDDSKGIYVLGERNEE